MWSAYSENKMLDTVFHSAPLIQLHTGDPGSDGILHQSPAKRLRVSWISQTGVYANEKALVWTNHPASEEITHVSFWDEDGHFLRADKLEAAYQVKSGDTFSIDTLGMRL